MNRIRPVWMGVLLSLGLLLAACGGAEDADDTVEDASGATDDAAAGQEATEAEEPTEPADEATDDATEQATEGPESEAGNDDGAAVNGEWLAGADEEWEEILLAGQEEGSVVVAGFPFLAEPMAEAFERDTGIQLDWLGGDGSENSARLEQEARAGSVTIDILLGGGRELQTLLPDDLLEPIAPQIILPGAQEGPQWRDGEHHWYDTDEQFLFQGAGYVFGWVVVNADEIDPSEIQVWEDLLKPEFQGQIIAYDPTTNGPGQGATGFMGARRGPEFLEELYIGQEVEFVQDNNQLIETVARGTRPIGLYAIQSSVERFRSEGFNLEVVLPEDDPGYITSGFGVLKQAVGVPHPNAAQVFINWYASQPGQQVYQDTLLETSNRSDLDDSALPPYVIPQEGVEYFDDNTEEFYTNERQVFIEEVTELLGGR